MKWQKSDEVGKFKADREELPVGVFLQTFGVFL